MHRPLHSMILFIPVLFLCSHLSPGNASAQESSWKAPADEAQRTNPVTADEKSINEGKTLFVQYCSSCHGNEGQGDGPVAIRLITAPPDLTIAVTDQTDGELAWKIATGKNPMPKWSETLSNREIWHIVNFIRSIQNSTE